MTTIPENVSVAFRFASALWPHDPAALSEATALVWSATLTEYSADELCRVLELHAKPQDWMPALATLVADLRGTRRRTERDEPPLLTPPKPRAIQAKAYRYRLRADTSRYHRTWKGAMDTAHLAEIDTYVDEIGEHEQ